VIGGRHPGRPTDLAGADAEPGPATGGWAHEVQSTTDSTTQTRSVQAENRVNMSSRVTFPWSSGDAPAATATDAGQKFGSEQVFT
jgi:hypothetical protein